MAIALLFAFGFAGITYFEFGEFGHQPPAIRALGALFAASSLLAAVSMLITIRGWRRVGPGVTVAAFVLDSRPAEEPDLSAWRWGRLALTSWLIAAAASLILCVIHALAS